MEDARTFTLRLASLLSRERAALGEFLVALASFDEHRLWVDLGYRSLFDFLHRELRLSKGAAFYRNTAAVLVQRFPEIVDPLRDGRLCLMTVAEVARVLDPGNVADVLPRFFGLSKREAQALVATLLPQEAPPLREVVTSVRAPPVAPALPCRPLPLRRSQRWTSQFYRLNQRCRPRPCRQPRRARPP
jgi:hypothetical protein